MTTLTDRPLDWADIQGNVLRGYKFTRARHCFYRVVDAHGARVALRQIVGDVTTAEDEHTLDAKWSHGVKPRATLNIAFTYAGLEALGIPEPALAAFPDEFRLGMRARASVLVDIERNAPEHWDDPWRVGRVHVAFLIMANDVVPLDDQHSALRAIVESTGGFEEAGVQDAAMETTDGRMREHFGFLDGFGNPDVAGAPGRTRPGRGKLVGKHGWAPIAAGEFLLGQRNEADEITPTPQPSLLFRNGTYMVYRKLHQNVATFRRFVREEGARYPGGSALFAAKLMGRWPDGTPLALSPEHPDPVLAADDARNTDFSYADDPHGSRCPLGAHVRRANPRDALGFTGALVNRRRLIRRGIPYGEYSPPDAPGSDDTSQGLLFIAFCADLAEQFEFVQQQWLNYGNDFHLGNDKDALIGTRTATERLLIPGDAARKRPTHLCFALPSFVETRGGDYFFMPSLTGLGVISRAPTAPTH